MKTYSTKLKIGVIVAVIVTSVVLTSSYLLMPKEQASEGTKQLLGEVGPQQHKQGETTKGGGVQTTGPSHISLAMPLSGPNPVARVFFHSVSGFTDIKLVFKSGPGTYGPDTYEFVLKPNSTGSITLDYDFSLTTFSLDNKTWLSGTENIVGIMLGKTLSEYFRDFEIYKFERGSLVPPPVGQIPGISIYPSSILNMTQNMVRVTYTVSVDASAQKNTYLIRIPDNEPGQFLTVGDKPYEDGSDIPD